MLQYIQSDELEALMVLGSLRAGLRGQNILMLEYIQHDELMWLLKSREVTERDWRDIISRAPIYPV